MAKIVLGIGTSHTPMLNLTSLQWQHRAEVDYANRKLNLSVELQPELIGGVRVVVGDEVLDCSVKARLEQMKVALTA